MLLASVSIVALLAPSTHAVRSLRSSHFGMPGQDASFDYVVIGGGTAGITIAARLAMDPSTSIAVIEAGGFYEQDNGNYSVLPGFLPFIASLATTKVFPQNSLMNWGLVFVPQTGAMNRRIHYAQGKTLSGCSGMNGMIYHRGTIGAYERWGDLVGDQSYTFSLLPYFEKSCKFNPPNNAKRQTLNATVKYDSSVFRSTGGSLLVQQLS